MVYIDVVGKKFGKWTVIEVTSEMRAKGKCKCVCECGDIHVLYKYTVINGTSKGCHKCVSRDAFTIHGMCNSGEYKVWQNMKKRCLNKNSDKYKYYGGRGITVCDEWLEFKNFYRDMGDRPEGTSIDRIDNNRGYSKENCRWATQSEQTRNQSKSKYVIYKGERMNLSALAELCQINYVVLKKRINSGWSVEDSVSKHIRGH